MSDEERDEEQAPRAPRVVDKRRSARPSSGEAAPTPPEPAPEQREPVAPPPQPEPPVSGPDPGAPTEATAGTDEALWTPEQEAQVRQMAEEMARIPSVEWVVNMSVNLANVAGVKLQSGQLEEAQLAIDALAGLLESCRGRLDEPEAPLRQTLAQLQMAYSERAMQPPGGPGGPGTP